MRTNICQDSVSLVSPRLIVWPPPYHSHHVCHDTHLSNICEASAGTPQSLQASICRSDVSEHYVHQDLLVFIFMTVKNSHLKWLIIIRGTLWLFHCFLDGKRSSLKSIFCTLHYIWFCFKLCSFRNRYILYILHVFIVNFYFIFMILFFCSTYTLFLSYCVYCAHYAPNYHVISSLWSVCLYSWSFCSGRRCSG